MGQPDALLRSVIRWGRFYHSRGACVVIEGGVCGQHVCRIDRRGSVCAVQALHFECAGVLGASRLLHLHSWHKGPRWMMRTALAGLQVCMHGLRTPIVPVNVATQGICAYHKNVLSRTALDELGRGDESDYESRARSCHIKRHCLLDAKSALHLHKQRYRRAGNL